MLMQFLSGRPTRLNVNRINSLGDAILEDLAPFMPPMMQSRMLRAASCMHALRQVRQAQTTVPPVTPRRSDPVELLQVFARYSSDTGPLADLNRNLQRVRQIRRVLGAVPGMLNLTQAVPEPKGPMVNAPGASAASSVPDFSAEDIQRALSGFRPEMLQRLQSISQSLAGKI